MDPRIILDIAALAGSLYAIYLGSRRLPGELRRNDAATINDLSSANSKTVATNSVLQDRIEELRGRLDALETVIELKDKRIAELEGVTADQDAKMAVQSTKITDQDAKITEQAGRIQELQAEIDELRRTQNGYMNGHSKDLSS